VQVLWLLLQTHTVPLETTTASRETTSIVKDNPKQHPFHSDAMSLSRFTSLPYRSNPLLCLHNLPLLCVLVNTVTVATLFFPTSQQPSYHSVHHSRSSVSTSVPYVGCHSGIWFITPSNYGFFHCKRQCDMNNHRSVKLCMSSSTGSSSSENETGEMDVEISTSEQVKGVVWYKIAIQGGTSSKCTVNVNSGEYVMAVIMAIKSSNRNTFENVDTNQVEVYASKKSKKPLDRAETLFLPQQIMRLHTSTVMKRFLNMITFQQ
jgi:hypothetical protein